MNELFRMNEYGDIWQEPELWDQPQVREVTKFQVCKNHEGWFAGDTRSRMAETFCEGGPGSGPACDPLKPCRLWPGRDFYCAEICAEELELDWRVNRPPLPFDPNQYGTLA